MLEIKQRIQQLIKELGLRHCSSVAPAEVQEMEIKLGLEFPKGYKEFLLAYGCLEDIEILGGGKEIPYSYLSTVEATLELREMHSEEFPKNCVAVKADGYGNFYCVVCGGKDNGKVIFWQHDLPPEKTYPNNPRPEDSDFWIEGQNFWEWLFSELQKRKELVEKWRNQKSRNEDKKQRESYS